MSMFMSAVPPPREYRPTMPAQPSGTAEPTSHAEADLLLPQLPPVPEESDKKEAYSKRPWSATEDAQLLQIVKKLGVPTVRVDAGSRTEFPQWPDIAKYVPGRTAKQCRERWRHNLDPTIKREPWSEEENQKLLRTYDELGSKWADIARQLPGRTDNACKNQWNKLSGTWKERRDEGARKERRANANRLSQSPSSVSAALLGLSGLANDNSNGVAWDASALLSVAISPKVATAEASQRGEKRRRQVIEAQKPFNDDALREAGAGTCNRTEGCSRPHGHRGVCKQTKAAKVTRSPRAATPKTLGAGSPKDAPGAPAVERPGRGGPGRSGPGRGGPKSLGKRVALQTDLYATVHTGLAACDPAEYVAQLMVLARTQARLIRTRREAIRTAAFGGVYVFEGDPLEWKGDWQKHWQQTAASRPAVGSPLRRPAEPNIGMEESAALRKAGRKGGAHVLPPALVSEETYAAPLEERDLPPSMRKKRKLETTAVANDAA